MGVTGLCHRMRNRDPFSWTTENLHYIYENLINVWEKSEVQHDQVQQTCSFCSQATCSELYHVFLRDQDTALFSKIKVLKKSRFPFQSVGKSEQIPAIVRRQKIKWMSYFLSTTASSSFSDLIAFRCSLVILHGALTFLSKQEKRWIVLCLGSSQPQK